jgi:hypothetical protein
MRKTNPFLPSFLPPSLPPSLLSAGADIILTLDECTPFHVEKKYTEESMERSHRWEMRSLMEFIRGDDGKQVIYLFMYLFIYLFVYLLFIYSFIYLLFILFYYLFK